MPQLDRFIKMTWWLAGVTIVIYCLLSFFYWSLIDVLTPFASPFLQLLALVLVLSAVVIAIFLPFRRWRTHRTASMLPLGFLVACLVITHLIDFTTLWLAANFRFRHNDREQVIRRVASGELRPNVPHNASLIALPRELAPVSLGGGEVVVQHDGNVLKILFFTFRGVLDNF